MGSRDEGVYILQQFWQAEIVDRTVTYTLVDFGNGVRGGTIIKTHRTRVAAQHAAKIELAKKLRIGYQALPTPALVALARFAAKQAADGRGQPFPKPAGKTYAARRQRFWRAERAARLIVTTQGAIGRDETKTTGKHAALIDLEAEGYYLTAARELDALRRYLGRMNARVAKQPRISATDLPAIPPPPAPTIVPRKPAARTDGKPTIVSRKLAACDARKAKRKGPFARTFTTSVVHFIKLSPTKASRRETAPRATSGGRPILAEGQAWPTCCYCRELLSLYLQFDIAPRMGLGFIPGSHLLIFNCATCAKQAMIVPYGRLPGEWLSPDNPQSYRVILNRPAKREAIFLADRTVLEQQVTLARGKEKISRGSVWRGRKGLKIGGIPAKIQGWTPPRCHCGAPLGFVFQEPDMEDPGWRSNRKRLMSLFGLAFIYACTKQCSPYATIVIGDR